MTILWLFWYTINEIRVKNKSNLNRVYRNISCNSQVKKANNRLHFHGYLEETCVEEICAKILTVDIKTKKLETQVSISRNICR